MVKLPRKLCRRITHDSNAAFLKRGFRHQNKFTPAAIVEDRKAERLMMGFINPGQNLEAFQTANRRMLVARCGLVGLLDSNKSPPLFRPYPSWEGYTSYCQFLQSVLKKCSNGVKWSTSTYFHFYHPSILRVLAFFINFSPTIRPGHKTNQNHPKCVENL